MSKQYLFYLSALIFLLYGMFASKWVFIFLSFVFVMIGISKRLQDPPKQRNHK